MSEQNRYQINRNYKTEQGWLSGWVGNSGVWSGVTWRDATQKWLDDCWAEGSYKVVAETPSEDGRSGSIEIQYDLPRGWSGNGLEKIKATLIEN